MDDESRKALLNRTEFWVVLAVVITFAGSIFVANTAFDIEALVKLESYVNALGELLQELDLVLEAIPEPTQDIGVPPTTVPTPLPVLPTVTP